MFLTQKIKNILIFCIIHICIIQKILIINIKQKMGIKIRFSRAISPGRCLFVYKLFDVSHPFSESDCTAICCCVLIEFLFIYDYFTCQIQIEKNQEINIIVGFYIRKSFVLFFFFRLFGVSWISWPSITSGIRASLSQPNKREKSCE